MRSTHMLFFALGLLLAAGAAGWLGTASGHEDADRLALEKRLKALELQVDYLLARETATTQYVVKNRERSVAFLRGLQNAESEGFTRGAISSTSREILLATLQAVGRDMGTGLPEVTQEQKAILEAAKKERSAP